MSKNSLGKCFQFQKNRCLFTHLSALFVVDIKFYYTGARKQSIYFEIHWDFLCSQTLIMFLSVFDGHLKKVFSLLYLYMYMQIIVDQIYMVTIHHNFQIVSITAYFLFLWFVHLWVSLKSPAPFTSAGFFSHAFQCSVSWCMNCITVTSPWGIASFLCININHPCCKFSSYTLTFPLLPPSGDVPESSALTLCFPVLPICPETPSLSQPSHAYMQ